jgi:hypothetical protein
MITFSVYTDVRKQIEWADVCCAVLMLLVFHIFRVIVKFMIYICSLYNNEWTTEVHSEGAEQESIF